MALASLDEYMPSVGDDITKFNQYVCAQIELLKARGCETHDLTVNLFKAYATVKDSKFREYIAQKESEYEENNEDLAYDKLMLFAENKFKIRKVRNQWNAPTPEEEKIIALEAYIKKMGKPKPNQKTQGKFIKNKAEEKGGRTPYTIPPWTLIAPNEGESKERTEDNKKYFWCPKHKKWTRHRPQDCRGANVNNKQGKERKL